MATFGRNPVEFISNDFKARLRETRVKDILPRWPNFVIARSNETIGTAFQRMIDNRVHYLPLLDVQVNKYVGFIDLFDMLSYVVEELKLPMESNEGWIVTDSFRNTSVLALMNRSIRSAWNLIGEDTPVQSAINMMRYVHRLAVIDSRGNLVSVMTQTRLTRWLASRSEWTLGDIANMTVEDFGLGFRDVVTINWQDRAIDAFMKMYRSDVSGLAVVDNDDRVIGNISVSDLKDIGYGAAMFRRLYVSCDSFLRRKAETGAMRPDLVYATRSTSIIEVLEKYKDNRVSRVYIVTPNVHKPVGVVTMTDIMSMFTVAPAA